ncbi:hypothetical protein ACHAWF_016115 [Thalassiosira exigua]
MTTILCVLFLSCLFSLGAGFSSRTGNVPVIKSAALLSGRQSSFLPLPSRRTGVATSDEEGSSLRRTFILSAPAALLIPANDASAAETTAEAVRLLSAKSIPGLGPPDVYYPPYFAGKWRVTRVIASSDDNFWKEMNEKGVNLPVTFVSEMRFVPYDAGKNFIGDENPNNVPAIADRSFNERSYHASLSDELDRLFSATKPSSPPIRSLDWTPTNPNVLTLAYADGSSKEVKVTKRSSDVGGDGGSVFSSEFRRITTVPAAGGIAGGIPSISGSRVLTKWKRASDGSSIEGIEIVYNEQGTFGENRSDPLLGGGTGVGAVPPIYGRNTNDISEWRSTKTKIFMERINA